MTLQGDKLVVQANSSASAPGGAITVGAWHHVALVGKETLTAYVDGQPVGQAAAPVPAVSGPVEIGAGYNGDMDEVRIAYTARSADWIKVEASGQGVDQHLLTYAAADAGDDSGPNYFKILLGSVTVDGWVVIGILMVMMVISFSVMILKGIFIGRSSRANSDFKDRFSTLADDLTLLEEEAAQSAHHRAGRDPQSMRQIYHVGIVELRKRMKSYADKGRPLILTAQSIDAIRAALDATLIRELQGLNAQMVLLTIAIAGGPFLGLLGTVVGVMITFAAIAAAGDVNVNAIAPGIAAALVATVAGLGVAIPSLFGYNYLASKIKELSTDMQVFVDEFVTRLAESYSE
jgi:biopolymer transport protein ExbB